MGDQESPHLGRAGLASQDALDRLAGLSLGQTRAGALPTAELAKQLPKAAKPCTQLFSPLVAALADWLLEIVGRQHGGTVSRCNPGNWAASPHRGEVLL
jgi:hypothetical protein